MKEKILLFFALIFIGSCAVDSTKNKIQKTVTPNDDWEAIEKIESERWNKEKIISVLGTPDGIINDKQQVSDILFYNYPKSNYQQWGFEVSGSNALLSITFVPASFNRKDFTIKAVIKKWGTSCTKKKEVDSSQHFIKNIYYLDCGKKHRAYLNRYDEVTSLGISLLQ
jgi:hypothetical protein